MTNPLSGLSQEQQVVLSSLGPVDMNLYGNIQGQNTGATVFDEAGYTASLQTAYTNLTQEEQEFIQYEIERSALQCDINQRYQGQAPSAGVANAKLADMVAGGVPTSQELGRMYNLVMGMLNKGVDIPNMIRSALGQSLLLPADHNGKMEASTVAQTYTHPNNLETTKQYLSNVLSDAEYHLIEEYGIDFSETVADSNGNQTPRYVLAQSWGRGDNGNFHVYDLKTGQAISRFYPEDGEKPYIDPQRPYAFGYRTTPKGCGTIVFAGGLYGEYRNDTEESYIQSYGRQGCYFITSEGLQQGPSQNYYNRVENG